MQNLKINIGVHLIGIYQYSFIAPFGLGLEESVVQIIIEAMERVMKI